MVEIKARDKNFRRSFKKLLLYSHLKIRENQDVFKVRQVPFPAEERDRAGFCPFAPRRVSVPTEPALGHLRCHLTDVPPQANCLPDAVFGVPRTSTLCRGLKAHTFIPIEGRLGISPNKSQGDQSSGISQFSPIIRLPPRLRQEM
ncbi:hypothetical protein TNCV_2367311 [Trichonephila clavipes]|nr:hypothetical protein TNCV_2367311 [Trichonephila clavipes]